MNLPGRIIGSLALVALLGIAGTGLAQQTVEARLEGGSVQAPQTLPGFYDAELVVTVEVDGGTCLCTQTRVEAFGEAAEAESVLLEPDAYTIAWSQNSQGVHEQTLDATIHVPDVQEPVEVTFDVEMAHEPNAEHVASQTDPATVLLPLPDTGPEAIEQQNASTETGDEGGEEDARGVPGLLAATVLAGVLGAAVLHRRH